MGYATTVMQTGAEACSSVHELTNLVIKWDMVKNVTVTADEKAIRWAKKEAAEKGTSLSRFVGELLDREMKRTDAYWKAFEDWKTIKPAPGTGKIKHMTREEAHERGR